MESAASSDPHDIHRRELQSLIKLHGTRVEVEVEKVRQSPLLSRIGDVLPPKLFSTKDRRMMLSLLLENLQGPEVAKVVDEVSRSVQTRRIARDRAQQECLKMEQEMKTVQQETELLLDRTSHHVKEPSVMNAWALDLQKSLGAKRVLKRQLEEYRDQLREEIHSLNRETSNFAPDGSSSASSTFMRVRLDAEDYREVEELSDDLFSQICRGSGPDQQVDLPSFLLLCRKGRLLDNRLSAFAVLGLVEEVTGIPCAMYLNREEFEDALMEVAERSVLGRLAHIVKHATTSTAFSSPSQSRRHTADSPATTAAASDGSPFAAFRELDLEQSFRERMSPSHLRRSQVHVHETSSVECGDPPPISPRLQTTMQQLQGLSSEERRGFLLPLLRYLRLVSETFDVVHPPVSSWDASRPSTVNASCGQPPASPSSLSATPRVNRAATKTPGTPKSPSSSSLNSSARTNLSSSAHTPWTVRRGVHVVYTPSPTSRSVLEGGGVRHVAEPKRGTDGRFVDVSHGGQSELLGLFEWETLHLFRRVDRILKLLFVSYASHSLDIFEAMTKAESSVDPLCIPALGVTALSTSTFELGTQCLWTFSEAQLFCCDMKIIPSALSEKEVHEIFLECVDGSPEINSFTYFSFVEFLTRLAFRRERKLHVRTHRNKAPLEIPAAHIMVSSFLHALKLDYKHWFDCNLHDLARRLVRLQVIEGDESQRLQQYWEHFSLET